MPSLDILFPGRLSNKLSALLLFVAVPLSFALAPSPAWSSDLLEAAETAGTFRSFIAGVKKAGLAEKFKVGGPYTVFAPSDEAVSKYGQQRWQSLDREALARLLLGHVIEGSILVTEVKPGPTRTLNDSTITLKSDNGKVTVGSANVTQSDIKANNGVIHAIDAVLHDD